MHKDTTCIALSAFALFLALGTTTASAQWANKRAYELTLECHNAKLIRTGTLEPLKVTFMTSSGRSYPGKGILRPSGTCTKGKKAVYRSALIDLPNSEKLTKIVIATTSDDGFWAKTAIAIQYDKNGADDPFTEPYKERWDVGFGLGLCLSTDASDANSQGWFGSQGGDPSLHIWGAGCVRQITLNVDGPIQAN